MSLLAGTKLAHYEILGPIGKGGMGEVYVAQDTKLGRKVALKILPVEMAGSLRRRKRFEQEAKAVAALNHPNIVTIYSVEEADGVHFLTMELIIGKRLAELVPKNGLPSKRFLEIAIPLTDAVAAAHQTGITHRDLKPENVMVATNGQVKVLDFGLAKVRTSLPSEDVASAFPSEAKTREGVLVGTLAYMSPEQAEGKPIDHLSDIFSLGVIFHELLTGRLPFKGETPSALLSSILKDTPPLVSELNESIPRELGSIVQRCLTKEPSRRMQSCVDLRNALEDIPIDSVSPVASARQKYGLSWLLAAGLSAPLIVGLVVWTVARRPSPDMPRPLTHFVIENPPPLLSEGLVLSPDGKRLVYVTEQAGRSELVLRAMEQPEAFPLSGTEHGTFPFFSPDGEWVGFFDRKDGRLKKISLRGGTPAVGLSASLPIVRGASWREDDTIFFSSTLGGNNAIWRISAAGGSVQSVSVPDLEKEETAHNHPEVLPGGKALLFTLVDSQIPWHEGSIAVLSLETGAKRVILERGANAKYVSTGHLLYAQAGSIFAAPFDLELLEVVGPSVPVLEGVYDGDFTVSRFGALSYIQGESAQRRLTWVDRKGEPTPIEIPPTRIGGVRIAPGGRFLAIPIAGSTWIHDLARGTTSRLTQQWDSFYPIWTPDGTRIVFTSSRGGPPNLWWKEVGGSEEASPLAPSEHPQIPGSFSPDGRFLAFEVIHPETAGDISILPLEGDRAPIEFLATPAMEGVPQFSPDGRWLAYISDETGRFEVYVRPYPGPGRRWQISENGGRSPLWARGGKEIFYRSGDAMMAVDVTNEPSLELGTPQLLFRGQYWRASFEDVIDYDVSPNGDRFLMLRDEEPLEPARIHVVVNWHEELERLVPTAKR